MMSSYITLITIILLCISIKGYGNLNINSNSISSNSNRNNVHIISKVDSSSSSGGSSSSSGGGSSSSSSSSSSSRSITTTTPSPPPSSITRINFLMFVFYATLGSAMPYLPIYYRSLGISDTHIGILGALTPAITFIVSPLWGVLADTTGKHKVIMLLTFMLSVITRSGLVLCTDKMSWLRLVVSLSALLNAPVKPLMDSAIMSMLIDKSDYGRSRLYGQLGFGFGSFAVGSSGCLKGDMKSMFLMQAAFSIPTILIMMSFHMKKQAIDVPKKRKEKVKKEVVAKSISDVIRKPEVVVFFTVVFLIGVSSGIIENFAYVRIKEASKDMNDIDHCLGICRLFSSIAGGPMFYLSGQITKMIGINGVLTLSMISYVFRFFNYSMLVNPWQALPAEIMRGITFASFWSASTYYVYNASPKGLTATMLGLLNGVYGGLGQSIGSLIGGMLSKQMGLKKAFFTCGITDLVFLVIFLIYQKHLSMMKQHQQ